MLTRAIGALGVRGRGADADTEDEGCAQDVRDRGTGGIYFHAREASNEGKG